MSIRRAKNELIWLAIANVRPQLHSDVLDGATGAHVRVFGLGADDDAFVSAARRLLNALEFDVIEIDEIEQMTLDEFRQRVTDEVFDIANTLNPATPVGYGTFYVYPLQNS